MAFIATYISTTGASELSTFWAEAAELSTAVHESIIKESYYRVNEVLDTFIQTPIPKQPTSGLYPSQVRLAQALEAIYRGRLYVFGSEAETTQAALAASNEALEALVKGRAHIEQLYSQDEIGLQYPVAGSSNTSTAIMQINRTSTYTGDTERIYTFTATSSANIGTATLSWANGEGVTGTFTSDYDFDGIEAGLEVRFMASPGGGVAIVSGDTWKVRAVPVSLRPDAPGLYFQVIPARN